MRDTYYTLERRLRTEMREYIRTHLATLVKFHPYSANSADGTNDKIQGYQTEGSDEQSYDFDARRVFPFGLRSRPPSGTFGVWIGMGGESGNGVIIAAESSRFGPSALNDGEVALYNKISNVGLLLDQNGAAIITDQHGGTVKIDGTGAIVITDKNNGQIKIDGTGAIAISTPAGSNVSVTAGAGGNVSVSTSGSGSVSVSATPLTGSVKLGPVGTLQVLVLGAQDPIFGAPIVQAPAAVASIVLAG